MGQTIAFIIGALLIIGLVAQLNPNLLLAVVVAASVVSIVAIIVNAVNKNKELKGKNISKTEDAANQLLEAARKQEADAKAKAEALVKSANEEAAKTKERIQLAAEAFIKAVNEKAAKIKGQIKMAKAELDEINKKID